jgi:Cytochrome c7 and related cytochrome c
MTRWNGDRPVLQRVSLAAKPQEASNLKFPHDMHLSKTNGVAQMARRLAGDFGFGQSLACKDCHDSDPSGTRFQPVNMEEDCGMCHSLAFDVSGGTLRTLRHGEPQQVVADLRDMFRARAPSPPATLGGMSRRRPGDVMVMRNARQFQIGSTAPGRADRAIRAVFSRGGACYDCHQVEAPASGLDYKIKPVAFPLRYMHKGWFDHKAHETETCESCHKAPTSSSSNDLLLPDLKSCRTCHGGEASNKAVPSSCAMCHDYHFDTGSPAFLIRQKVRGKERDSVAEDNPVVAGGPRRGGGGVSR